MSIHVEPKHRLEEYKLPPQTGATNRDNAISRAALNSIYTAASSSTWTSNSASAAAHPPRRLEMEDVFENLEFSYAHPPRRLTKEDVFENLEFFDAHTPSCHWHWLAKSEFSEEAYRSSSVQEKLKRLGGDSVKYKGCYGYSPLHIAAITGNTAAIRFLCSKGASSTELDSEGYSPLYYCSFMHDAAKARELLKALVTTQPDSSAASGSTTSSAAAALANTSASTLKLEDLFKKWHTPLATSSFTYQENTQDFGLQVENLMILNPATPRGEPDNCAAKTKYFAENMKKIAEQEGFQLTFSHERFFLRDLFFRNNEGKIVTITPPEDAITRKKILECALSKAFVASSSSMSRSSHTYFHGFMGGGIMYMNKSQNEFMGRFGLELSALPFYIEGGNLYVAINAKGGRTLLLGEDQVAFALNHMRLNKTFEHPQLCMDERTREKMDLLTEAEIWALAQEMYSQGLLSIPGSKGLVTEEEIISSRSLEKAINLNYYNPLNLSKEQVADLRAMTAEYQVQKETVLGTLAIDFGVDMENVHLIPQVDYHLDAFMRPGPKGSILIQNYAFCAELLESIKAQADALQLTNKDKKMLNRYVETAHLLNKEIGPLITAAEERLKAAGFTVLATPGIFMDSSPKNDCTETFNVNFLNAITGWSEKQKAFYYIVGGAKVGDRLGKVLMESFQKFLSSYQEKIHVHYVGCDPNQPEDFSEAMSWWNQTRGDTAPLAGAHCFSFELNTKTHQQQ